MTESDYGWPEGHDPEDCPVSSWNELQIAAPVDRVWAALVRAVDWPSVYANASDVDIDGGGPDLSAGVTFRWKTFGLRVETTVREFEVGERLAWYGEGYGSSGYHSWTLHAREGGCLLVTEETQRGFVPFVARWYLRGALHRQHDAWLRGLATIATQSTSPS